MAFDNFLRLLVRFFAHVVGELVELFLHLGVSNVGVSRPLAVVEFETLERPTPERGNADKELKTALVGVHDPSHCSYEQVMVGAMIGDKHELFADGLV